MNPLLIVRRALGVIVPLLATLPACSNEDSGDAPGGAGGSGGEAGAAGSAGQGIQDGLSIEIESGVVQGKEVGDTRAFLGIPFAAPPIDDHRWKSPAPVDPWSDALDTTVYGPECPQFDVLTGAPSDVDDEDCLTLNVWTPKATPSVPRPVMVWFTGGAFVSGSGRGFGVNEVYVGDHLVPAGDVVLVTVNYRLGSLGFLALPALDAEDTERSTSGNYGIEDQRFALEWVRRNILAFGGDAENVTIFGESAGGISACVHIVSPESRGLFHRAIMQSGPCNVLVRPRAAAEAQGAALAAALGCDGASDGLGCLRGAPADDVIAALPTSMIFGSGVTWGPVIDGVVLPGSPRELIEQGNGAKVPVVLGSNADEGTFFVKPQHGSTTAAEYPDKMGEIAAFLAADPTALLAEYSLSDYATPADALSAALGEGAFNCPTRRQARALADAGADVYLYHFEHAVDFPALPGFGVFHASDLPFVFQSTFLGFTLSAAELPLSDDFIGYWTRHADVGDPNGGDRAPWPRYTASGDEHIVLDLPISSGSALRAPRCDFWDSATP